MNNQCSDNVASNGVREKQQKDNNNMNKSCVLALCPSWRKKIANAPVNVNVRCIVEYII